MCCLLPAFLSARHGCVGSKFGQTSERKTLMCSASDRDNTGSPILLLLSVPCRNLDGVDPWWWWLKWWSLLLPPSYIPSFMSAPSCVVGADGCTTHFSVLVLKLKDYIRYSGVFTAGSSRIGNDKALANLTVHLNVPPVARVCVHTKIG
jgi:hypothetical protein